MASLSARRSNPTAIVMPTMARSPAPSCIAETPPRTCSESDVQEALPDALEASGELPTKAQALNALAVSTLYSPDADWKSATDPRHHGVDAADRRPILRTFGETAESQDRRASNGAPA
jgi:hypothetical protein